MAIDTKKLFKQAKEAAKSHNLFTIEDVVAFIPCSKESYYRFFPLGSDEYDAIKTILETNKIKTKSAIRAKLFRSDKSAELIALYKLIATNDERKALSMNYVDLSNTDGSLTNINITVTDKDAAKDTKEVLQKYATGNDDSI